MRELNGWPEGSPKVIKSYGSTFVCAAFPLIQDGDITSTDSRWSCKPELSSSTDSTCSITYSLSDSLSIEGLNIGECVTVNTSNQFVHTDYFNIVYR